MSRKTKIILGVVAGAIVLSTCAVHCSRGNACGPGT